jgi:ribosomal protein S18 acetylase RimI-like enzyme
VRPAKDADADAIGRLLHDFNSEFNDHTPGPSALARRARELLAEGQTTFLLGGAGPEGLVALRFRPSIWERGLECYVAELYVVPRRRGVGLGRALMQAALAHARERGAEHIDLATSDGDVAARALYESLGFTNREDGPGGPVMYCYEREL